MNQIPAAPRPEGGQTPAYVFDLAVLRARVAYLRAQLPPQVKLCYAVKANTFLLQALHPWVDHLEICSWGEYQICKALSLPEEKFVLSGVVKEPELVDQAVGSQRPLGCFTAESPAQLALLTQAARRHGRPLPLLLRLTSGNQFGMDEETLTQLVRACRQDPHIRLRGIQYFSGTQKFSLKKLRRELAYVDEVIQRLAQQEGYVPELLEFGPGLPVAYFEGEDFDEPAFLAEFSAMLSQLRFSGPLVLELGRSIAASCGTYLTRVVDLKRNRGEGYALVDGGIHQLTYYGQAMAMRSPRLRLLPDRPCQEEETWTVCGSLCTINDILVKRHPFPALAVGDVLAFENAGAYCATEGLSLFLSRDLPQIRLRDEDGRETVVREGMWTVPLNTSHHTKGEDHHG